MPHKYISDISIVKSCGFWLIFDDDLVDVSNSNIYLKKFLTLNLILIWYKFK